MGTGVLDSKKKFHEIYFYEIKGLFDEITKVAIEDEDYKKMYDEYKNSMTRFASSVGFALDKLGWMICDPTLTNREEALFSNGHHLYIGSKDYINKENFKRENVNAENVGYETLTDTNIGYKENISIDDITEGFIDELGYISSSFVSNLESVAEIIVMYECISNKDYYEKYIANKEKYKTKLAYLLLTQNIMYVKKREDGKLDIKTNNNISGRVKDFLNNVKETDKVADLKIYGTSVENS